MIAAAAVGLALIGTGAVVGVLSGASPLKRALRQLAIGFGAAAATYALGLLFGATLALSRRSHGAARSPPAAASR